MKLSFVTDESVCLIQQKKDGRIYQIALTQEQHKQLQLFLGILSKSSPLVEMGEEHDLLLKSSLKTCMSCEKKTPYEKGIFTCEDCSI
jgi:hypothetical protein